MSLWKLHSRFGALSSQAAFFYVVFIFSFLLLTNGEKKVSVSEVVFDSPVEDIQWMGPQYSIVLCRTLGSRLYRSLDSGRAWNEITKHMGPFENSRFAVKSIHVNPIDKNTVIVLGKHDTHYVSGDGGATFREFQRSGTVHSVVFHPLGPRQFLMSQWTEGCTHEKKHSETCRHDLYYTSDLGATFRRISRYVVQFAWGDPKLGQQDRIYVSRFDLDNESQPRGSGWSEKVHFGALASPSSSFRLLVLHGNKFLVSNGYIFVAQLVDRERQTVKLLVSTNGASTFQESKLPVELQQRSYTIVDTSQGAVIIHVNHGHSSDQGIAVGNVYISDSPGIRYSLSLPKNVRTSTGECEFDSVASLEGIYIANYLDDTRHPKVTDRESGFQNDNEDLNDDEDNEDEAVASELDRRRGNPVRKGKHEATVKTVISFDKGGVWSYLRPPSIDSRGQKVDCSTMYSLKSNLTTESTATAPEEVCSLHLHGITNFHRYAPFYSVKSAVGLVMGTGNVGNSLRYESEEMNTYLSRDGGLTWLEAHKGAYIYEFGDHGGLIVMANDMKTTKQVVFSWNEGQSWYDFDLGDQLIDVDNVVIEPNSSSVEFLLYGTRGSSGVLYHLDFSTLDQPACKGVWAADSVSSDYETWTPTDGRTGSNCLLGRQLTYTRRKPSSECFNGRDFERPIQKRSCVCTERDYECEYGFTRHIGSMECIPEDPTLTQEGCTSSGIFYADAYRRIPGDGCEDGWKPSKVPVLCPHTSPLSGRARGVLGIALGIVGLLGALTILNTDPRFHDFLHHYGIDSVPSTKYMILGVASRLVEGFESEPNSSSNIGQRHQFAGADHSCNISANGGNGVTEDPLHFIESAHEGGDEDDAPPLLDFSHPHVYGQPASTEFHGVALETVPKLQPPPSSSSSLNKPSPSSYINKDFEML